MVKSFYLLTGISNIEKTTSLSWWLHQMETFSALLAISCREFTGCRWIPFTKASNEEPCCFFDLRLNKRLSKQSRHRWFETPSCSLWRHFNDIGTYLWFWCTLFRHVLQLDKTVIHNSSCFRILSISWHVESYEVSWQSAMTQSISPWIKHLAKLDSVMVMQILLVGSRSEKLKKYWSHLTKWKTDSENYWKCADALWCYSCCKQSLDWDYYNHRSSWKGSTVDDQHYLPNGPNSHFSVGNPLFNSRVWTYRYSVRYVYHCVVLCFVLSGLYHV